MLILCLSRGYIVNLDDCIKIYNQRFGAIMSHPIAHYAVESLKIQAANMGFYTMKNMWFISNNLQNRDGIGISFHVDKKEHVGELSKWSHNHDYFELGYMYKGSCVNYFENESIELNEGDIILLNPNVKHRIAFNNEDACLIEISLAKSVVNNSTITQLTDNNLFSEYFIDYFYQVSRIREYMFFKSAAKDGLERFIEDIVVEITHQEIGYIKTCEALLIIIFARLARMFSKYMGENTNQYEHMVSNIILYIAENYKDVTIEVVAQHFNYSPRYIYQIIKKHTNKRFVEIQQDFKLEKAKEFLEQTHLPVSQIAEMVGFNDASYLHKVFKNKYGITPSECRDKN